MRIVCQTFSLPKEGRELADYEDASFPYCENQFTCIEALPDTGTYRCAVCDGATDSVFSKQWAEILATGYGTNEWAEELSAASLERAQTEWKDFVSKQELPWYAEEKVQLGAFSAFVGLTLFNESQQWRAVAVGDSCLFHTRNGQVVDAFPITKSSDFNNFPLLLASLPEKNEGVFEKKCVRPDGHWQSGDVFMLMSDALACWFLRSVEDGYGEKLVEWLTNLELHDEFAEVVRIQRGQTSADGSANMRDDDVTLARIRVSSSTAPLPVSAETATSKADSIQTLTLGTRDKEQVKRKTMIGDTVSEVPSTPLPSAAAAPAPRPAAIPEPPKSAAERAAMRMHATPPRASNSRNLTIGALVIGIVCIVAAAANSMMHSKPSTATKPAHQPGKKLGALMGKGEKKPGTVHGAEENSQAGELEESAPPAASNSSTEPLIKEGTAGIASGTEEQKQSLIPRFRTGRLRNLPRELSPGGPNLKLPQGAAGNFPDQPGSTKGPDGDNTGKLQY